MTASTTSNSFKQRDPDFTWVVRLKSNGISYPNWGGESAAQVLWAASDYLKQPINNLTVHKQMEWS